jgi:ferredoxin
MAKTHKVTFKKSGITIDVAEDEYILEEAEDAGLHLPYDCRSGTCTTCIQKCLEGEIDQDMAFAIGDEELEQGLRRRLDEYAKSACTKLLELRVLTNLN